MIEINGYYIEQYPNENKIVIRMPQTIKSLTNTIENVSNRKFELTDAELAGVLIYMKRMFEEENTNGKGIN